MFLKIIQKHKYRIHRDIGPPIISPSPVFLGQKFCIPQNMGNLL